MSQSPTDAQPSATRSAYESGWEALGAMISRGRSFSGFERNCCFLNTGSPRFATVSAAVGLDLPIDSRALAAVDWDWDGDLDLWLTNREAPRVRLLRNELPRGQNFVGIRLRGVTCNRDAIGARVEVHVGAGDQRRVLIRTLRAGEGFLGQNSKWMHFGLGNQRRIARLVIRWPDGTTQQIDDLKSNQWQVITQEVVSITRWKPKKTSDAMAITPGEAVLPPRTTSDRVLLTSPQPLPKLNYLDWQGQTVAIENGSPTVIYLWASGCPACLAELRDVTARAEEISASDVKVVALSTDELSSSSGAAADREGVPTRGDAWRAVLEEKKFPLDAGLATKELVREIKTAWHKAIYLESDLQLPCSFLIDSDGRLSAIYTGRVEIATVLADAGIDSHDQDARRKAAFPFEGEVAARLFDITPIGRAYAYREGEYWDEATRELARYVESLEQSRLQESPDQLRARMKALASTYLLWGSVEQQRGEWKYAKEGYEKAMNIVQRDAGIRLAYAQALWNTGDESAAISQVFSAMELGEKSPGTFVQTAKLWLQLDELKRSQVAVDKGLQRFPKHVELRFTRAVVLEKTGDYASAAEVYRELLEGGFQVDIANNLAYLYATCPDEAVRNGQQAVDLAEKVAQQTSRQSPSALDTLAAALAENGEFASAQREAVAARQLAFAMGQHQLAEQIDNRIELYRREMPLRTKAAKVTSEADLEPDN